MRKLVLAFIVAALAFVAWVPGAGAAQTSVTISGSGCAGGALFCYSPANVTIHDGDTVVWTNQTVAPHTVTRCTTATCAGTDPGTGTDATFTDGSTGGNGTTFSHTFHGAGTYAYFCTIHGFAVMHGTVTVLAAATGTTTPATIAPAAGAASGAVPAAQAPAAASPGSSQPATANPSAQASNRALARTGVDTSLWTIAGGAVLGAGVLLALVIRRARRTVPPVH